MPCVLPLSLDSNTNRPSTKKSILCEANGYGQQFFITPCAQKWDNHVSRAVVAVRV